MKGKQLTMSALIRTALMLALALCWIAGCDMVAGPTPSHNPPAEGATTMSPALTAARIQS